jgi:hypothetical protein
MRRTRLTRDFRLPVHGNAMLAQLLEQAVAQDRKSLEVAHSDSQQGRGEGTPECRIQLRVHPRIHYMVLID